MTDCAIWIWRIGPDSTGLHVCANESYYLGMGKVTKILSPWGERAGYSLKSHFSRLVFLVRLSVIEYYIEHKETVQIYTHPDRLLCNKSCMADGSSANMFVSFSLDYILIHAWCGIIALLLFLNMYIIIQFMLF